MITVNPIVARVLSIVAKPLATEGDGRFERLDVIAKLDVSSPGDYALGSYIARGGRGFDHSESRPIAIGRGRQTLTASIPGKPFGMR